MFRHTADPVEGSCKYREGPWRCVRTALFAPDGTFIQHTGEPGDRHSAPSHRLVNVQRARERIIITGGSR